jgi:hypothetical protein
MAWREASQNTSYLPARFSLGVKLRPSDLDTYNIPKECRLEMTEADIKTGKELLNEEFIQVFFGEPSTEESL